MSKTMAGSLRWLLPLNVLIIGSLGILNLSSAAREAEGNLQWAQALWFGVGWGLLLVMATLDYRILDRLAYPFYIACLLSLIVVLVAGRIIPGRGAQRWIHLGLFNFQPSEMMKVAVILAIAKYFNDEAELPAKGYTLWQLIKPATPLYAVGASGALILFWEKLDKPGLIELGGVRFILLGICLVWAAATVFHALRSGKTSLHDLLSPVIMVFLPAILIVRQPDLGTALILFAIAGSVIIFVKVRFTSLVIVIVVLAVGSVVAWNFMLQKYQKDRILSFVSSNADSKDSGWHAKQSMIAVGSGKVNGKGFGESTQTQFKFLPEQHTDFAFSVWAEEWGFLGSLLVIVLFFVLLLQLLEICSEARDKLGLLIGVGVLAFMFWHVVINIGMVIGLLPVVGITLPLWSYGGSSVLTIMISIGLVMSVSLRRSSY